MNFTKHLVNDIPLWIHHTNIPVSDENKLNVLMTCVIEPEFACSLTANKHSCMSQWLSPSKGFILSLTVDFDPAQPHPAREIILTAYKLIIETVQASASGQKMTQDFKDRMSKYLAAKVQPESN